MLNSLRLYTYLLRFYILVKHPVSSFHFCYTNKRLLQKPSKILFMKKIKLLLMMLLLGSASAFSQIQQVKIVNFSVKNQLPTVIDSWNSIPGALLLVAQLPPTVRAKGIRLIIQITLRRQLCLQQ